MRFTPTRFLQQTFEHLFFLWSVVWLLITGLLAGICYFAIFNAFSGKKAQYYTFIVTQTWARVLFTLIFVRVGKENQSSLNPEQAYVFVSNHRSALDIPICMYACQVPFSFLAKKEVDKIPIIGYLARHMHVYVDRKNTESRRESFVRMQSHLQLGKSIHIYPEGTRNRSSSPLLPFHDGAFRLAIETQTPLVVMSIQGSGNTRPFSFSPMYIHCIYSAPIETKGLDISDIAWLKAQAEEQIRISLARSPIYN